MQFSTTITAMLALAGAAVNGAYIDKRVLQLGGFTLSTTPGCPLDGANSYRVTIVSGQACGECVAATSWNSTYKAITDNNIDKKCTVTLYNNPTCSGDGAVSGPTCWTPEGGIAAYKVACPWWDDATASPGGVTPCYH